MDGNLASVTVKTKATGPIWFWDDNYLLKYRGWPVGAGYSGLNNKAKRNDKSENELFEKRLI